MALDSASGRGQNLQSYFPVEEYTEPSVEKGNRESYMNSAHDSGSGKVKSCYNRFGLGIVIVLVSLGRLCKYSMFV